MISVTYKVWIASGAAGDLLPGVALDPVLSLNGYLKDLAIAVIIVRDVVSVRIQVSSGVTTNLVTMI